MSTKAMIKTCMKETPNTETARIINAKNWKDSFIKDERCWFKFKPDESFVVYINGNLPVQFLHDKKEGVLKALVNDITFYYESFTKAFLQVE